MGVTQYEDNVLYLMVKLKKGYINSVFTIIQIYSVILILRINGKVRKKKKLIVIQNLKKKKKLIVIQNLKKKNKLNINIYKKNPLKDSYTVIFLIKKKKTEDEYTQKLNKIKEE